MRDNRYWKKKLWGNTPLVAHKNCPYCKEPITYKTAGVDHKIPTSRGGKDNITNVHLVCKVCNMIKGDFTHDEFEILIDLLSDYSIEIKKRLWHRLRRSNMVFSKRKYK